MARSRNVHFVDDRFARFVLIGMKDQLKLAEYSATVLMRQLAAARERYVAEHRSYDRATLIRAADGFCLGWAQQIRTTVRAFAGAPALVEEVYAERSAGLDQAKTQRRKVYADDYAAGQRAATDERLYRPMTGAAAPRRAGSRNPRTEGT